MPSGSTKQIWGRERRGFSRRPGQCSFLCERQFCLLRNGAEELRSLPVPSPSALPFQGAVSPLQPGLHPGRGAPATEPREGDRAAPDTAWTRLQLSFHTVLGTGRGRVPGVWAPRGPALVRAGFKQLGFSYKTARPRLGMQGSWASPLEPSRRLETQ